jgi:hypothetical protein
MTRQDAEDGCINFWVEYDADGTKHVYADQWLRRIRIHDEFFRVDRDLDPDIVQLLDDARLRFMADNGSVVYHWVARDSAYSTLWEAEE